MMKLCLYGAGGFGKEVYDIALRINKKDSRWDEIFFIDDIPDIDKTYNNSRLFSVDNMLEEFNHSTIEIIIAIGEPVIRKKLFNKVKSMGIKLATLVDPSALISDTASMGEGVIVAPFSNITCSTVLGCNVAINAHSTVGHDITIGDHTVISTNVTIGGNSVIGKESFIGLGAQTKENLSIGSEVIIGMGAIVFKDIPDKMIAMGNPARPIRRNENKKVF